MPKGTVIIYTSVPYRREGIGSPCKKTECLPQTLSIWLVVGALLFLAADVLAADCTLYVCQTAGGDYLAAGSDLTGDGTLAHPFASIDHALGQHTAANPGQDTVTVKIRPGDTLADQEVRCDDAGGKHQGFDFVIEAQDGQTPWYAAAASPWGLVKVSGCTAGSITVRNLAMTDETAGQWLFVYSADRGMDLTFEDCVIDLPNGTSRGSDIPGDTLGARRAIAFRRCRIDVNSFLVRGYAGNPRLDRLDLEDTTVNVHNLGSWTVAVDTGMTVGEINVHNCSLTAPQSSASGCLLIDADAAAVGKVRLRDAYLAGSRTVRIYDHVGYLWIDHCTIQSTNPNSADAPDALMIGQDAEYKVQDGIGMARITGNTLASAGMSGLWLGFGADGAEIAHNRTTGASHATRYYSGYLHIHHNICTGSLALFESGKGRNHIHNNTCFATDGAAFLTGIPSGSEHNAWTHPVNSFVYNNIFVNTHPTNYCFWDYEGRGGEPDFNRGDNGPDLMAHWVDYNCYWHTGTQAPVCLGPDQQTSRTIAELRDAWLTAGPGDTPWNELFAAVNDTHSVVADPLFVDPLAGDFRLRPGSPCLQAGKSEFGSHVHMGAWQEYVDETLPYCGDPAHPWPTADLNRDCTVDLQDLGAISDQWSAPCAAVDLWCNGSDLDQSGSVALPDLALLAQHWLDHTAPTEP